MRSQFTGKIIAAKMNKTNEEIFDLVQKLEAILTLLDQQGYALPAIKIEEALLALRQLEEESKD